jgi:hypothetical protein
MHYSICKSCQYPLGICQRVAKNLWHPTVLQFFQRDANILLTPITNLPKGCQQPMAPLQEGCSNCTQRGNLFCSTAEKSKIQNSKLKIMKQLIIIKTIRGACPNKALSIHTTNSPSQSRETVPLTKNTPIMVSSRCHFEAAWIKLPPYAAKAAFLSGELLSLRTKLCYSICNFEPKSVFIREPYFYLYVSDCFCPSLCLCLSSAPPLELNNSPF